MYRSVLTCLSILFCYSVSWAEEPIIYRQDAAQIIIPECPLTPETWAVESVPSHPHLYLWNESEHASSYQLLQKAARLWSSQGVSNYLVGAQDILSSESTAFEWQFVPFDIRSHYHQLTHLSILWNLTFGTNCLSLEKRLEKAQYDQQYVKQLEKPFFLPEQKTPEGELCLDVFCDPKVIVRQEIYEGKWVRLLYNYAPIGPDKQHFLIVPIAHRENFNTLTLDEYLEAMQISGILLKHYQGLHYTWAYLFHKTGKEAGQTVFHWHLHLVFLNADAQGFGWIGGMIKNMLFGTSPLPPEELEKRVQDYRHALIPLLSNPSSSG